MLLAATIFITGALVFYSIGVWGERIKGTLSPLWLAFFWAGLVCDTVGTAAMGRMAGGPFQLDFHGITGLLAILLMLVHAVWATAVLAGRHEKAMRSFHKFSLFVWLVWLVPYLSGMVFGMGSGS